jgi:virginiamycin B lyase
MDGLNNFSSRISRAGYAFVIILLYVLIGGCSEPSQPEPGGRQGSISQGQSTSVTATAIENKSTGELLLGKVTASNGSGLAGVPIQAHRANSNITVAVYTNNLGEYAFPQWSDLTPGTYSISIELAEYETINQPGVVLTTGETERLDFTLQTRNASVMDATATDIVMALPGTDEQKFLLIQCDNCHSLQWALRRPHTHQEWETIVKRMFGVRRSANNTPGTRTNQQQQYIEPLVEYLTEIRGPESSEKEIPFAIRPRPTDELSTSIVVTEYDIPRGGEKDPYLIRADNRYAWPHDIIVDDEYGYYTDHFSHVMGRLDKTTGEVRLFPFEVEPGTGRPEKFVAREGEVGYPGRPGGGPHDILFDSEGRVIMGMRNLTVRYDPNTEKFTQWNTGSGMFGLDPNDNVWVVEDSGELYRLNMRTDEVTEYRVPPVDGIYDIEADSQGRAIIDVWGNGFFRVFDPKTETHTDYPTPTPASGPRRGVVDSQDRHWVALYWAGLLAMFDPNTGEVKEYPLIPGTVPFGPPFSSPYSVAMDEKNQIVWTSDFNSSRIYMFDIKTEKMTEFFMPEHYEVRDLTVDEHADKPTLWIPSYRPPSKIVKVQLR